MDFKELATEEYLKMLEEFTFNCQILKTIMGLEHQWNNKEKPTKSGVVDNDTQIKVLEMEAKLTKELMELGDILDKKIGE